MARRNISSGHATESQLGYSRAVRVGPHVWVTGTASTDARGHTVGVGDIEAQTRHILRTIEAALVEAGATLADVVRTRNMLVNMDDFPIVGRVHGEIFGAIRPASVAYEVGRFIDPEWLIEIEVDACIDADRAG